MMALTGAASNAAVTKTNTGAGSLGQLICGSTGQPPVGGPGAVCSDGNEPYVVTPGKTLSDTLSKSLTSNQDLIVNANDWTGLALTVSAALFQQYLNAGVNGILGSAPAGSGIIPTPPPPPLPVICAGNQSIA